MTKAKDQNPKRYDLEERTYKLAKRCRDYIKKTPQTMSNIEYNKQLINSSGSVAANYIEANEAVSKKDFVFRIKICRKEAKESHLWVRLTEPGTRKEMIAGRKDLIKEAWELTKIFGGILKKCQEKKF